MPLSNARTGTLALTVFGGPDAATQTQTAEAAQQSGTAGEIRSVWEGMSGSAVWAGSQLIGVVVQHHPSEGATTLTVAGLPTDLAGTGSRSDWSNVPALSRPTIITSSANVMSATFRRSAQRLAPPLLSGRNDELMALDAFAAGGERWRWYSAGAFGGKTALLAWWAAHQQAQDTAVVSVFLRRSAGLNTARDVIVSLSAQLGAAMNLPDFELRQLELQIIDGTSVARLETLLQIAAQHCRRLLVVVDGLDEFEPLGQIPVTEWLPGSPNMMLPSNAALIISSRAGAPTGIPDGHPLHNHKVVLQPSTVADKVRRRAEQEILHALRDPGRLDARIIGFLAAAGGPLTHADLKSLIQPQNLQVLESDIRQVWSRYLARTLIPDVENLGYEFSHDALREYARASFAGDLPSYRDRIHAWADGYARQKWPRETPRYLLGGYAGMLATERRTDRLVAIATDTDRQARLRKNSGGDSIGLGDLTLAADLLTERVPVSPSAGREQLMPTSLDLHALGSVVWHRDQLRHRNRATPPRLPVAWARLGQFRRAENLAGAITDSARRIEALMLVAIEEAHAGLPVEAAVVIERVEQTLNAITDLADRSRVRTQVVASLANAGMVRDAVRIAGASHAPGHGAVPELATALAVAGKYRDAMAIVREFLEFIRGSDEWLIPGEARPAALAVALAIGRGNLSELAAVDQSLADSETALTVAMFLALDGRSNEAHRLVSSLPGPAAPAEDLIALATLVGQTLAPERAMVVAVEIQRADRRTPRWSSDEPIRTLVTALVDAGFADAAEQILGTVSDPEFESRARTALVEALTRVGRHVEAARVGAHYRDVPGHVMMLAAIAANRAQRQEFENAATAVRDAEHLVVGAAGYGEYERLLAALAIAVGVAGLRIEAERIISSIPEFYLPGGWFREFASAVVRAGTYDDATRLVASVTEPARRVEVLTDLAIPLIAVGDTLQATEVAEEAERIAAALTDPVRRTTELTSLAGALWQTGDTVTAAAVTAQAELTTTTIKDPEQRDAVLRSLATKLGQVDQPAEALKIALTVHDSYKQAEALFATAIAFAESGDYRQSHLIAREAAANLANTTDPGKRAWAQGELIKTLAATNSFTEASDLAVAISEPSVRAKALMLVAHSIIQVGRTDELRTIIHDATRAIESVNGTYLQATLLGELATLQASVRNFTEAEQLTARIGHTGLQADARLAVAASMYDGGEPGRAATLREAAEQAMPDPDQHARWLTALASALARNERYADAEQLLEKLVDPRKRARALAELAAVQATTFAEIETQAVTKRLIADAWSLADWPTPLDAIARVDPSVLLTLARLELEQPNSEPAAQ